MFKHPLAAMICSVCLLAPLSAQAKTPLVLYTSQPNKDAQQTVDAFEKANPDIDVEWVRDGTTKLMARLHAELESGVVRPDVLLIADSVTMESMKQQGYLQPYLAPQRTHFNSALYDAQGYFYGTKEITTGIVYNTRAAMRPTSWSDLAKVDYKGQVAMPSPLYSGAALIHLDTLVDAPDLGWNYYRKLADNHTQAQGGNGGVLKTVASGTKAYGVIVDFMAIRAASKGSPVKFVFPQDGSSMVTEPVAIMKGAQHVDAAHKFVDFVLSEPGQTLVRSQGYIPARDGMTAPAGFPPRERIKLLPLDRAKALMKAAANKQAFSEIFSQ